MSNFSEYINKNNTGNGNNQSHSSQNARSQNTGKRYSEDELQEMINKYSNYGENQLVNEFIKLTIEKKKRGELKESDIAMLKNTLSPMLNQEQRESLNKILEMVKNVK